MIMKLLVAARLNSEYKLRTTLNPIIQLDMIDQIYLIRRYPIDLPKTKCYSPPKIFQKYILTSELYRVFMIFLLCLFRRPNGLMGIHFILHCVYTALAKIIFRIPLIMLIIESPDKYKQSRLFNFFIRRADLIGVRGHHSRDFLIRTAKVKSETIFVTPDVHDFKVETKIEKCVGHYDLVFVGYYTKAKRIDVLLEVMAEVRKKIPQVRLALIGDGELKPMVTAKIAELSLQKSVDCLGHVKSIYPYLKNSKVFIMTSQTEGLPTVLLEALNYDLPFIVPDVGDIRDLAIHDYNAIVVKSLDIDAFANACIQMLTNSDLYNRMQNNSAELRKKLQSRHSFEAVQNVWEQQLRQVLK